MTLIRTEVEVPDKPAAITDITEKSVDVKKDKDTEKDDLPLSDRKILIDGPLSSIYTNALNEIYKNKKVSFKNKVSPVIIDQDNPLSIYAVDDVNLPKYGTELTDFLYGKESYDKIVIMPTPKIRTKLIAAVENLAQQCNVRIFNSLEDYLEEYNRINT
jgi:hypothetical protein